MSLRSFLIDLRETGRARVEAFTSPLADDMAKVHEVLSELDSRARLEMPFQPPQLSLSAALWGATMLYRSSQFLVFRELGADLVKKTLSSRCPERPSPETSYSVDLTFRYLPDLVSLARGIAEDDPLVGGLLVLARTWPLSSVGILGVGDVDVSPFMPHPSLRQTYVDRILERRDLSRLSDPRVREAAQEALGLFTDLCPTVASILGDEAKL